METGSPIRLSVVIPVYRGQTTLPHLLQEIAALTQPTRSPNGHMFFVGDTVLVHDCGPDDSDKTIQSLKEQYPFVRPVWLTKNFGQHPATLAGMASATGDYVVTMDEDGQQNPADIGKLLDTALTSKVQVVYAKPLNPPPHGFVRNSLSVLAKRIAVVLLGNKGIASFNSYRLIDGEIARSLAAFCGSGVFLDVALFWMTGQCTTCPVTLRKEMDRPSGYSFFKLLSHFWQLLLTSGTRPLRIITLLGFTSLIIGIVISAYALWAKFHLEVPVQGWTSIVIVVSFFSGCILMSLGVIAEYLAVTMTNVMGKPLYLVGSKPRRRPTL